MTAGAGAPASGPQPGDGQLALVEVESTQPVVWEDGQGAPDETLDEGVAQVHGTDLQPGVNGATTAAPADDATAKEPVIARRGRRRQRQVERRSYRLTPRFSGEELAVVSSAAALAGLTPTGYVAKVAVDVATARVRPVPVAVSDAIAELLQARYQVQKFSQLVNQAVAKWHSTEVPPPQLLGAVALVGRVLPRLEEAALAVRLAQHDTRPRRLLAPRAAAVVRQEGTIA